MSLPQKLSTARDKNYAKSSLDWSHLHSRSPSEDNLQGKSQIHSLSLDSFPSCLLMFAILLNIHPHPILSENNLSSNFSKEIEVIRQALLTFLSTLLYYQIFYISVHSYSLYNFLHSSIALYTAF